MQVQAHRPLYRHVHCKENGTQYHRTLRSWSLSAFNVGISLFNAEYSASILCRLYCKHNHITHCTLWMKQSVQIFVLTTASTTTLWHMHIACWWAIYSKTAVTIIRSSCIGDIGLVQHRWPVLAIMDMKQSTRCTNTIQQMHMNTRTAVRNMHVSVQWIFQFWFHFGSA